MNVKPIKTLTFAIITICAIVLTSCSKYDEGPAFSLLTKAGRLSGDWEVIDAAGELRTDTNYVNLTFDKDGGFSYYQVSSWVDTIRLDTTYTVSDTIYVDTIFTAMDTLDYKGEWTWEDKKEVINLNYDGPISNDFLHVLKLTKDEFWFNIDYNVEWRAEKK